MPAIQTIVATAFNKAETVVEEHEDLTAEAGMSAGARTINALEIGYTSPRAFAQVFRRIVGVGPTAYRDALSFKAAAEQRWKSAGGVSHRITGRITTRPGGAQKPHGYAIHPPVASLPPHL